MYNTANNQNSDILLILRAKNFIFAASEPSRSSDDFAQLVCQNPMENKRVMTKNVFYDTCHEKSNFKFLILFLLKTGLKWQSSHCIEIWYDQVIKGNKSRVTKLMKGQWTQR